MHLLNLLKIMSALCIGIQPVICCETNETGIYDKHVKKCEMDMTINGLTIPKDFLRLCRLAMYINPMDTYAAVADTCNLYTNIRVKPLQDIEQMNFFDKRNIVITRTNDGNNIIIVTGITVIALDKKRLAERVLNAKIFDILDIAVLNYQTDTSKTNADELREAAEVDGCPTFTFFCKIVLPLSGSIIAIMVLYYAVAYWNSFFNALIYLSDANKYPLQMIMRDILITGQALQADVSDPDAYEQMLRIAQSIKYGVIIVSSLPVLVLYPFVQKHFVKGIMIGSLKG